MIIKRAIFRKVLSTGAVAEFVIAKNDSEYTAALFLNGKFVPGPSLPVELTPPKDDLTHWMGNRPSIGLTLKEAEQILREVDVENSVLRYQAKNAE